MSKPCWAVYCSSCSKFVLLHDPTYTTVCQPQTGSFGQRKRSRLLCSSIKPSTLNDITQSYDKIDVIPSEFRGSTFTSKTRSTPACRANATMALYCEPLNGAVLYPRPSYEVVHAQYPCISVWIGSIDVNVLGSGP